MDCPKCEKLWDVDNIMEIDFSHTFQEYTVLCMECGSEITVSKNQIEDLI